MTKIDIVVTWPKNRPLEEYVGTLAWAKRNGEDINYRVSQRPSWEFGALHERPARCYRVHDGAVRGYTEILYVIQRDDDEVHMVGTQYFWPGGIYVVCDPTWYPLEEPVPMRGFQGWRWIDAATLTP